MSLDKTIHRRPIRWVLLDRDGTINAKAPRGDYITAVDQLRLLPHAAEAIRCLNDAHVWVAVVTNQRGIALGDMSHGDLQAVHERLIEELARHGAHVNAVYYCPHAGGICSCRKPEPGLLLKAQRDHGGLIFADTAMVGDMTSDVEAGQQVGATTILLADDATGDHGADHVASTLIDAVEWLKVARGLADGLHAT